MTAIQFAAKSETYDWTVDGTSGIPVATLAGSGACPTGFSLARKLVCAALRTRADTLFFCHYERWPVLLAAIALRLSGRRVITMMDSKYDDYPRWLPREMVKRLFLAPYHGAMTASDRGRDYLRFLGFGKRPVEMGYDALSVARIVRQSGATPAPDGVPHKERDFLIVARLVPKKNIGMALQAFALWRAGSGAQRRLVIMGSGPLEQELRNQAAALGIAGDVDFRGFVQTEGVSKGLARALCLLLPSIEEQFGMVVTEAMAMGVPPLVSRAAGALDVLVDHGVNGWVIDPRDPEVLAQWMEYLSVDEAPWRLAAEAACLAASRGDVPHFVTSVKRLAEVGSTA